MKTYWEKITGRRNEYVIVNYNEVVVGHNYGTGMTDAAGSCSHESFLKGEFHGLILERFGQEVLDEVIQAVEHSHENDDHNEKRAMIRKIKEYLDEIPIDENLRNLIKDPRTINGFYTYGNKGNYDSFIESDTTTFFYSSTKAKIENNNTGEVINFELDFHGSSCVELDDNYYMIGGDNLHVFSKKGEVIYTTERPLEERIFGYEVRIGNVYRNGNTIFVSYWAFDDEMIPRGLLKVELDKGLTGRIDRED